MENMLHGATKLNIQEIYITRVSVCNLTTLYRAQSGFQSRKGRKKVAALQRVKQLRNKKPVL
jgi:hypothetical protein